MYFDKYIVLSIIIMVRHISISTESSLGPVPYLQVPATLIRHSGVSFSRMSHKWNPQYVLGVWLLSGHAFEVHPCVVGNRSSILCIAAFESISLWGYTDCHWFIHLAVCGLLGCFQFFAIMNKSFSLILITTKKFFAPKAFILIYKTWETTDLAKWGHRVLRTEWKPVGKTGSAILYESLKPSWK